MAFIKRNVVKQHSFAMRQKITQLMFGAFSNITTTNDTAANLDSDICC